jgi:hypothetical protein
MHLRPPCHMYQSRSRVSNTTSSPAFSCARLAKLRPYRGHQSDDHIHPFSIFQNSQAVVINSKVPTFHPTSLNTPSQSHFLPHKNASHPLNPSGTTFLPKPLGVESPLPDVLGMGTLLVTHIWIVRDHPVVIPITTHARSGRLAPRMRRVRYVAGQQRH